MILIVRSQQFCRYLSNCVCGRLYRLSVKNKIFLNSFLLFTYAAVGKSSLTTVTEVGGNRGFGVKKVISWSLFIAAGWSRLSDPMETVRT